MKRILFGLIFLFANTFYSLSFAYNYQPNPRDMASFAEMMLTMMEMMGFLNRHNSPTSYMPNMSTLPMNYGNNLSPNMMNMQTMPFPNINNFTSNGSNNSSTLQNNSNNALNTFQSTLPSYLNGIWQGESGNVMAIYHSKQFLWSDNNNKHLFGGEFRVIGNKIGLAVTIRNKQTLLEFNFQFYGTYFTLVDKDDNRQFTFHKIH